MPVYGILGGLAATVLVVIVMVLLGEYTKTRGRWLGTALPVAEETSTGGRALLTVFCAGIEVACKMAEANLTMTITRRRT